ncbi:hypothetical protein LC613_31240 [Nostoc sphaeroides CHAB 2801]|uniref:hypothetical protein n=1 Tax=Nostoc sphaeroides TaxID=446679 RepID=UPI001E63201C|nr:hypothetical protein [Nostoc sphaeroides]MCC5632141.1 hypothetical protein [Nostoc sphaeroides CHAB 2801]
MAVPYPSQIYYATTFERRREVSVYFHRQTVNPVIPILYEDAQNLKRTAKYAKSAKNRELVI